MNLSGIHELVRLVDMKRRYFIPLLVPVLAIANKGAYEKREVSGWSVIVSRKLLRLNQPTATEALELLRVKLEEVQTTVPTNALAELKRVTIWMEYPDEGIAKCAAYHPSEKWLTDRGHHPGKTRCVEFGNPTLFIQWSETQPSMVLHELAHAYHHQVLTHQYAPIKASFSNAQQSGLYETVRHANGKKKRAYALNNEKEFFAELTETYFGRNDFHPFTRTELEAFDPESCTMIKEAWGA